MQVRAMKGVEAVRHRSPGGEPELGIWLSLDTLLTLPVGAPAQLELWRGLLAGLGPSDGSSGDECRVALLAALCAGEPLQGCHSLEAGSWQEGRRAWQSALEHHGQLLALRPAAATAATAQLMEGLVQMLARLDQALTHRQWRPPASPRENAQAHGIAAELLLAIHGLGGPLPAWFAVVEEGLLRRGALALLLQADGACRRQGIALLLRLAQQHLPVPAWLPARLELAVLSLLADLDQSSHPAADLQALVGVLTPLGMLVGDSHLRLQVQDALALADGCLALDAEVIDPWEVASLEVQPRGAAVEPHRLTALVRDWLDDHPASELPVELHLVWIPGARPLPHSPGQLALNLAAVVPDGGSALLQLEPVLAAFFEPLVEAGRGQGWRLGQPIASLMSSLRQFWSAGGSLTGPDCRALAAAQGLWQRWGGPELLGAHPLPPGWPPARLEPGCCLVQPSPVQLAGLRSWLLDRQRMEQALALIRRHHHDPAFMAQSGCGPDPDGWAAVPALCALHVAEGFYAATSAPLASLRAWAEPSLDLLAQSQWLLDAQQPTGSWWAVLQGLVQVHSRLPELVAWPEDERFYQLLAGQEVVVVSPLAGLLEDQHRSGRAFGLFADLVIEPYGLRCVSAPASLYPDRPHQGFEASLAAGLEAVEVLARQRPFSVFLCAAGAYDLPLCLGVRERYGATCVAMGSSLHARFGIEQPISQHWRRGQRRSDRWRRIS
jgi:hypothetical protein